MTDKRVEQSPDQAPEETEPTYGFPVAFWRALERRRPPGVDPRMWRSPLRGPWLTSVFGVVLLVSIPVVTVTGLLSYMAYGPQFGQARPDDVGFLRLPMFDWPTRPSWLYRLNQGVHVGLGLVLIPVVLAKLWSVVPRLFAWPPARSMAQVLERLTLLLLVGGILFEIATGLLNIQYDYIFGFSFYTAHYYGGWVFIAGFVSHVMIKLPRMMTSLRSRSLRAELRTSLAETRPEPRDPDGLVAVDPAPATVSRRGALAIVGGGSLLVFVLSAGQTIGGAARPLALLLPRGRELDGGPNGFPVNRTAAAAGVTAAETGVGWQLTLTGAGKDVLLDRSALLTMPQHTATLPIACVEGWSTTESWTGVRLRDLAALVGIDSAEGATVTSLEKEGAFNESILNSGQATHPDALLAMQVNGAELSLDHGFPARIIVPAMPGVLNTKWVASIDFGSV